ncbi:MAG: hypothetical protein E6J82_01985 [Deltaproteobacteria bacterium]|nr:MAG: hypothetical protein E6J82_01985 [Deltaproteobacteria bacterium]
MKVFGIDPGSRYCGFGVVEDAGGTSVRHLAHGVLEVGAGGAIEDRLCALHEGLSRDFTRRTRAPRWSSARPEASPSSPPRRRASRCAASLPASSSRP